MYPLRPNDQRNLLFTDKNAEAQLRFVLQTLGIFVQVHISSFCRHWQQEAESEEAKLRALNSRLNELRERYKQAQREVGIQEVRTDRKNLTRS
jgi:predicted phage tail protein